MDCELGFRPVASPPVVVPPEPLTIVKRRSMCGSEGGGASDDSAETAIFETSAAAGRRRSELGSGATPSSPLRVRRVRPRAIRGEGSLYSLRTASPAFSSRAGSWDNAGVSVGGGGADESLLGSPGERAPCVLVPNVKVTPEVEVVRDGETSMWVAVEVGALLGRPDGAGVVRGWGTMEPDLSEQHARYVSRSWGMLMREAGPISYGCLYNLAVEVLPTPGTSVLNVVQDEPFPVTVNLSAAILMLVQLRLSPSTPQRARRSPHRPATPKVPTSESLFRDLETQLGASPREYLGLRLRYSHSAFVPSPTQDLVLGTRLETVTTSTIRRQDPRSLWARGSEYGDAEDEAGMDLLLGIITGHWEAGKARRAVEMIVRSKEVEKEKERTRERQRVMLNSLRGSMRTLKRSPAGKRADVGSRENVRVGNSLPVSVVPERQASLGRVSNAKGSIGSKGKGANSVNGGAGGADVKGHQGSGKWSWGWW